MSDEGTKRVSDSDLEFARKQIAPGGRMESDMIRRGLLLDIIDDLLDARRRRPATGMPEAVAIKPGGSDDPHRNRCFRDMQVACAGLPIGSVLAAHVDSMAACAVIASPERRDLEELLDAIRRDLGRAADRNWDAIKRQIGETTTEIGHG